MPIPVERSLFKIGSSLAVTLPRVWTRRFQLQAGDQVEILVDGELVVKVKKEDKKKSLYLTKIKS